MLGGSVVFEVFIVYYGRDCNCHSDIVLLVRSCCSQTGGCSSIFGMQAVGHVHWRTGSGPDLHRGVRGEYPTARIDYRYRGPHRRTSRKTSVGPRLLNRADVYVRSDAVLYEM